MSQNDEILSFLQTGQSLTAIQALELFKCFRLAARIANLRDQGHNIKTTILECRGKRYASYKLEGAANV